MASADVLQQRNAKVACIGSSTKNPAQGKTKVEICSARCGSPCGTSSKMGSATQLESKCEGQIEAEAKGDQASHSKENLSYAFKCTTLERQRSNHGHVVQLVQRLAQDHTCMRHSNLDDNSLGLQKVPETVSATEVASGLVGCCNW